MPHQDGEETEVFDEILHSVAAAVGSPAIVFDRARKVRAVNDPALRLLGVDRRFIVGKGVELTNSLYVPQEVRQERDRLIFEESRIWDGSWMKVHSSGMDLPSRLRVIPLAGTDCYLEVLQPGGDTVSRQDAEFRLLASMVELTPTGLLVLDASRNVLFTNRAFDEKFNRGRKTAQGTPAARFFEPSEYLRVFGGEAGIAGIRGESATLTVPGGSSIPVRIRGAELQLSDDPQEGHVYLLDFEDRSELAGAQEDATLMIESIRHVSEAVLLSDPSGVLFFANPAAVAMLGVASEEALVGTPIASWLELRAVEPSSGGAPRVMETIRADGSRMARQVVTFQVTGEKGAVFARGWAISGGASRAPGRPRRRARGRFAPRQPGRRRRTG